MRTFVGIATLPFIGQPSKAAVDICKKITAPPAVVPITILWNTYWAQLGNPSAVGVSVNLSGGTGQLLKGSGTLGVCLGTSSARFKHSVKGMEDGLREILGLKPINFYYNKGYGDDGAKVQYGFLAEDAVKVIPKLVGLDDKGRPNSVDILGMVPILVKAMQELKADNDNLRRDIAALKAMRR